jgi:hypothetical protein
MASFGYAIENRYSRNAVAPDIILFQGGTIYG